MGAKIKKSKQVPKDLPQKHEPDSPRVRKNPVGDCAKKALQPRETRGGSLKKREFFE